MQKSTLATLLLCLSGPGCLSFAGRYMLAEQAAQGKPAGVVAYPGVWAFGQPQIFEFDPFYIFDIIDLPFSLVVDTLFLPYDLTHPHEDPFPDQRHRTDCTASDAKQPTTSAAR